MQITHTSNVIGAHVTDVDVGRVTDAEFSRIESAFDERGVICIRNQTLTEAQLLAFARRFGGVEPHFLRHYTHPQHPEILLITNIQENGKGIGHADASSVLASVLPELVNQMTPQGQVPQGNALDGVLGSLLGQLGSR